MKKIHLATSAFPYPPGEQFLADEVVFWGYSSIDLHVLPSRNSGRPLELPSNITLECDLVGLNRFSIIFAVLILPLYREFYREISNALRSGVLFRAGVIKSILVALARVFFYKKKLRDYVKRHGPIDLLYCYWNDAQAYAACMEKRNGLIRNVISRVHGGDLYKERWPSNYVPVKWQFINEFDAVYVLSDIAAEYLKKAYMIASDKVFVSPLGVLLSRDKAARSPEGCIHIVSVASCVSVKRIDRIIEAIKIFSQDHRDIKVKWTHMGDGPLFGTLRAMAGDVLGDLPGVIYEFLGQVENASVREFYLRQPCDVFLNLSESEGMPVAIMEAMSAGIPAIAPNVGGISELIEEGGGILLSSSPSPREAASAIWLLHMDINNSIFRKRAVDIIAKRFNAAVNYPVFISDLTRLLRRSD